MRKLLSITIALLAFLASSPAFARHHHYQHHQARLTHQARSVQPKSDFSDFFKMPLFSDQANYGSQPTERLRHYRGRYQRPVYASLEQPTLQRVERPSISFASAAPTTSEARPSDCYGIQWCGCYLRHYFGIRDASLNLAANWRRMGSPTTAHPGAIAVLRSGHHVGVLQSEPDASGHALLLSGNNGSGNRATVRRAYVGGATFRQM